MIITLTANPSLDRTIELNGPVLRGQVQRARWAGQQPGGKGVNVSRAIVGAGRDTLAILPAEADDPVLTGLDALGVDHDSIPIGAPVRSNVTVTEPDGTTTKINEPGSNLDEGQQAALLELLAAHATRANWVVLAGSLPPGVDNGFYAQAIERLRALPDPPLVAVDTSGPPLAEALQQSPDLITPNAEELAELLHAAGLKDVVGLKQKVALQSETEGAGDSEQRELGRRLEEHPDLAARAAHALLRAPGLRPRAILATLGAGGAVLASREGTWHALHPPVVPVSTVGAGDSTLAGFLLARLDGQQPQHALIRAVAYGAAAARLPGTGVPTPADVQLEAVIVRPLTEAQWQSRGIPNTTVDHQRQLQAGTSPETEEAR